MRAERKAQGCLPLFTISNIEFIHTGGTGMYIETKSIDELLGLVKKNGFSSTIAGEIKKEMEQSKETYNSLICSRRITGDEEHLLAVIVTDYYLAFLERLRKMIPYDAMGDQSNISLMVLQEFNRKDIVERIYALSGVDQPINTVKLKLEIQKFKNIQLEPQSIVLYMDILKGQVAIW